MATPNVTEDSELDYVIFCARSFTPDRDADLAVLRSVQLYHLAYLRARYEQEYGKIPDERGGICLQARMRSIDPLRKDDVGVRAIIDTVRRAQKTNRRVVLVLWGLTGLTANVASLAQLLYPSNSGATSQARILLRILPLDNGPRRFVEGSATEFTQLALGQVEPKDTTCDTLFIYASLRQVCRKSEGHENDEDLGFAPGIIQYWLEMNNLFNLERQAEAKAQYLAGVKDIPGPRPIIRWQLYTQQIRRLIFGYSPFAQPTEEETGDTSR